MFDRVEKSSHLCASTRFLNDVRKSRLDTGCELNQDIRAEFGNGVDVFYDREGILKDDNISIPEKEQCYKLLQQNWRVPSIGTSEMIKTVLQVSNLQRMKNEQNNFKIILTI